MIPQDSPLATPLNQRHKQLGATMAPFAGWEMPLWYKAGAIREHLAVIETAGIFDTSHMDVITVSGENSRAFLNYAFTRDLSDARPGRCAYGAFLDDNGHCLDDAIIYPIEEDRFGVVLNASMSGVIRNRLADLPDVSTVEIREASPRPAKIDIQGPLAATLAAGILSHAKEVLTHFPYFSFKGDFDPSRSEIRLDDGTPVLLSRTGYTGELGFELFLPLDKAEETWDKLLRLGEESGVLPCGLAARDSLRTGAVLPLSHQDIGAWPYVNHPWPFALPLDADRSFTKDFAGCAALAPGRGLHTYPFAGFDQRRVDGHEAAVLLNGEAIGKVTTIVSDMAIGRIDGAIVGLGSRNRPPEWKPRGLACGFVLVDRPLQPGTELVLKDSRREIRIETTTDIRPDRSSRRKLTV